MHNNVLVKVSFPSGVSSIKIENQQIIRGRWIETGSSECTLYEMSVIAVDAKGMARIGRSNHLPRCGDCTYHFASWWHGAVQTFGKSADEQRLQRRVTL
jgi:hypothetical protein